MLDFCDYHSATRGIKSGLGLNNKNLKATHRPMHLIVNKLHRHRKLNLYNYNIFLKEKCISTPCPCINTSITKSNNSASQILI